MEVIIAWDDWNREHALERHNLTQEEVEEIIRDDSIPVQVSRDKKQRPCKIGRTSSGKLIFVAWEESERDPLTVYPITAYDPSKHK